MIRLEEALSIIESIEVRLPAETLALDRALGRIPARDPVSRIDQPPFDKSTMDGFAYASTSGAFAEPGEAFRLVGAVAAGEIPGRRLASGECVRIMTGAPVPEGATAVHRLERASQSEGRVVIEAREGESNIVRRAANRPAGETIFPRRALRPQDIGMLAANGMAEIEAIRRPRLRVLSTGDELVAAGGEPSLGDVPGPGRIFDSNGPQLLAQARAAGCEAFFGGIVRDDELTLRAAIEEAAETADIVIVSGGVSAGDFDYVPSSAEKAGFRALFHGIAMKPGKPAFLGRRGECFLYGMPGNPLSAFVNFEVLIRPMLARLCGIRDEPATSRVRLGASASRRELDRVEFLPVDIRGGLAFPVRYTGSTMLDALAAARGLIRLEIGQAAIEAGAETDARLI
jgi:molybdopterin molybdotransferase